MQNGKMRDYGKDLTEMEKALWKKMIERLGPLNMMELSIRSGIEHVTLWKRFCFGKMNVREYEALEGII